MRRHGPTQSATLSVARGERVAFSGRATDSEGDLWGSEWYLDGDFLGAQHISSLPDATGSTATFWRGINFPELGTYFVEAEPFDRKGNYGSAVSWNVQVTPRPRLLYVDETETRILTPEGRAQIANQVATQGFDHVALYRLYRILPYPERTAELRQLMHAFRGAGVKQIFGVVGSPLGAERIGNYLSATSDNIERFDGMITEYEFWNPKQDIHWPGYLELLSAMNVVADAHNGSTGQRLSIGTYLGWLSECEEQAEIEVQAIVERVDTVLLHAYVDTPEEAFGRLRTRFKKFAGDLAKPVEVWPIFSAECEFMGPWIVQQPNPFETAENVVLDAYRTDTDEYRNGLRVNGFAWFAARRIENAPLCTRFQWPHEVSEHTLGGNP